VAVAQQVFRELAPDPGDDSALLLHSRFTYGDRAAIEKRIEQRHRQRRVGDPALREGGLVVSTQALEVSLCLDFDRGVSEMAPVEALAQRAGRVNRLGLHPDGPAEFRVHATESHLPYEEGAVEAAMLALRDWNGKLVSEQAIDQWLECAYETQWGQEWADIARESKDGFAEVFLTFPDPFSDRSEFADRLDEQFDSIEVVLRADADRYRKLASGETGDPLLAADLLIPTRLEQKARLQRAGRAQFDRSLGLWVIDAPYDPRTGLDLSTQDTPETIL
jgi:CRISPR-associated endonuclease/helicase Cas3